MLSFDKECECVSECMTLGKELELCFSVVKEKEGEKNSACEIL